MLPTHLEDYLEYKTKLSLIKETKINIIYFYYLLINNNI